MQTRKRQFIVVIGMMVLAELIGSMKLLNPIYYASPSEIFFELLEMLQETQIYYDVLRTIARVLTAIICSFVVSVPFSMVIALSVSLRKQFMPLIDFLRSIPPIVFYPLLLIIFGSGEGSRIAVAIFGATTLSCLIMLKGLDHADQKKSQYLVFLGARKKDQFRDVLFYQSFAPAMTALRTTVSLSLVIIIVTEMLVGSKYGLGNRIQQVQIINNIPDLFASILILGIFGLLLNRIAARIERVVLFWREDD